jgi:diguanylate cyclase
MSAAADQVTGETAAEYLRIAVPLMSRHRVPATPDNYATWYEYVSGRNQGLTSEIDRLIDAKADFTEAVNAKLYRQYVAEHDLSNIEQIRGNLNQLLGEIGATLHEAGDGARCFEGTLGGIADNFSKKTDLDDIRQLLKTLVKETRQMQSTTTAMQSSFEQKSREIEELQDQLQRERKRAITDPLTGLYNRAALIDELNTAISDMDEEGGQPPSLIMLDIDHFKSVNDTHGHLIGDRVIRFVAQVLQKNTKGKDTAARYGGEEFTVLLPGTPAVGAQSVAEVIRKAVASAQLVRADNKQPLGQITISAGVATYQGESDAMDFIDRADRALYQSKNNGRNRTTVA